MATIRTHRMAERGTLEMAERRTTRSRRAYTEAVLKPLRAIVDDASETGDDAADAAALLNAMDASTLEKIDNGALADDMQAHLMQATAIGAATGPRVAGSTDRGNEGAR